MSDNLKFGFPSVSCAGEGLGWCGFRVVKETTSTWNAEVVKQLIKRKILNCGEWIMVTHSDFNSLAESKRPIFKNSTQKAIYLFESENHLFFSFISHFTGKHQKKSSYTFIWKHFRSIPFIISRNPNSNWLIIFLLHIWKAIVNRCALIFVMIMQTILIVSCSKRLNLERQIELLMTQRHAMYGKYGSQNQPVAKHTYCTWGRVMGMHGYDINVRVLVIQCSGLIMFHLQGGGGNEGV